MVPKDLSIFHKVVLAGSIRKASLELGVAPSSISRKILILERQFGTNLFDRSSKGLALTYAGQLVAEYAQAAVLDFESLRADIDDLRGVQRRLIQVAVVESFSVGCPMEAVARFRKKFEGVTFHFMVVPAPRVPEMVRRGECDLGIAFCAAPDLKIKVLDKVTEPILIVASCDHPIAKLKTVSLMELSNYAVALPQDDFRVRDLFDQACYAEDVAITPTFTANTFGLLRDYIRSCEGVAVLPYGAVAREIASGEFVGLHTQVEKLNNTTIDFIVRKHRLPKIVRIFVDELLRAVKSR